MDSSCLARAQLAVPILRKILSMVAGEEGCMDEKQHYSARRVFQHLGLHHVLLRLLSHIQMDRAGTEAGLAYAVRLLLLLKHCFMNQGSRLAFPSFYF